MRRISTLILVITAWLSLAAQQPQVPHILSTTGEAKLHGRIVLYDWFSHEINMTEDFVFKILEGKADEPRHVRVIYKPFWGWDAPAAQPKDMLDRWAFVGRGASWSLSVHSPQSDQERAACAAAVPTIKYQDEGGSGEISRLRTTPGAELGEIPSIESLTCFILNPGGLERITADRTSTVTTGMGAADR